MHKKHEISHCYTKNCGDEAANVKPDAQKKRAGRKRERKERREREREGGRRKRAFALNRAALKGKTGRGSGKRSNAGCKAQKALRRKAPSGPYGLLVPNRKGTRMKKAGNGAGRAMAGKGDAGERCEERTGQKAGRRRRMQMRAAGNPAARSEHCARDGHCARFQKTLF